MKRVVLLNDKELYNKRYRYPLIKELQRQGFQTTSIGLFDGLRSFVNGLLALITERAWVSSNLKTNIVALLFFWTRGTIILNGLGRWRDKNLFRLLLCLLFFINWRKRILIQNYADYRYFSIFTPLRTFHWLPGSGGSTRSHQPDSPDHFLLVTRATKLPVVEASVEKFLEEFPSAKLLIAGCTSDEITPNLYNRKNVIGKGYVAQDKLFHGVTELFVPLGYGEGIPHVLVDALCSKVSVVITPMQYRQYGLFKVGGLQVFRRGNYVVIKAGDACHTRLGTNAISKQIIDAVIS